MLDVQNVILLLAIVEFCITAIGIMLKSGSFYHIARMIDHEWYFIEAAPFMRSVVILTTLVAAALGTVPRYRNRKWILTVSICLLTAIPFIPRAWYS